MIQANVLQAATVATRAIERELGIEGKTRLARSQDLTLMLALLIGQHLGGVATDDFADSERGHNEFDRLAARV